MVKLPVKFKIGKIFTASVAALGLFFCAKAASARTIPVALGTDGNYVYPTMVTETSILKSGDPNNFFDIYVMTPGNITPEEEEILTYPARRYSNCKVTIIDMNRAYSNSQVGHLSPVMYYYTKLPSLLKQYDKCIFLESDTLVKRDLAEMLDIDLTGYYVGGVHNSSEMDYAEFLGVENADHFLNPGSFVYNLKAAREDGLEKKFENYIETVINAERHVRWYGEDVINAVCFGKILNIPCKYNLVLFVNIAQRYERSDYAQKYQTKKDWEEGVKNPVVVHYCIVKPWSRISRSRPKVDYQRDWWKVAKTTPYINDMAEKFLASAKPRQRAKISHLLRTLNIITQ
jgi:lipopolysaccharide biosynthesis glycosyltransferase